MCIQPKSCKEAALALLACMQQQPCMKEQGGTLKECLQSEDREACTVRTNEWISLADMYVLDLSSFLLRVAYECIDIGMDEQVQRNAYFECKRGQLDMRTRIRGQRVY